MYGNSIKANWRASLWEVLASQEVDRHAWCICLAGPRFLDRKEAERHGFRNVIGVDLDESVVNHNTAHGRSIIKLPLSTVVAEWDRPIALINADYTCGIGNQELEYLLVAWLSNQNAQSSVLALTVSKGREQKDWMDLIKSMADGKDIETTTKLSRPYAWMCWTLSRLIHSTAALSGGQCTALDAGRFGTTWTNKVTVYQVSYKAHKQVMQTAVFGHLSRIPEASGFVHCLANTWNECGRDVAARRHIAAKLAWQTMNSKVRH